LQKTESAKNSLDSMSRLFFQSFRVQQVAPTVSPVGSVGASALCAEVSTGDPHPLQGRQKGLFNSGVLEKRELFGGEEKGMKCLL
jgi:hypothetical protein